MTKILSNICPLTFGSEGYKNIGPSQCCESHCQWWLDRIQGCAVPVLALYSEHKHGTGAYDEGKVDGYSEGFKNGKKTCELTPGNYETLREAILDLFRKKGECGFCGRSDLNSHSPGCPMDIYGPVEKRIYGHSKNYKECPICGISAEKVENALRCLNCGLIYGDEEKP